MHLCLKHKAAHDDNTGKNTAIIVEWVCTTRFVFATTLSRALRLVETEGIEKRQTRVAGVRPTDWKLHGCLGAVVDVLCTGRKLIEFRRETSAIWRCFRVIV